MSQTLQIMKMGEQIADLEWQLQQVIEDNDYYQKENEELQEEINEWKTKFENLQKYLDTQNCYRECAETWQKNKELQEQIEKTKWHDLRKDPNDLPREGTRVFSETGDIVLLQDRKWKEFSPNGDNIPLRKWEEPIAWCEIPKYTKEIKENEGKEEKW